MLPSLLLLVVTCTILHTSALQNLPQHADVLILGGGVAGVIAARTLSAKGINFILIEARNELGGRMQTQNFSGTIIERGPNWIQGTQDGDGPANPMFTLANKHMAKTQFNDWFGSITTYDNTGFVDYMDVFNQAVDDFETVVAVAGDRVSEGLVDLPARSGYGISGIKTSRDPRVQASEYYQFDWEYAQTPAQSSWITSAWGNNYTYVTEFGGFSDSNVMAIDQRGFKYIIQSEAQEFLKPEQLRLNSTVKSIKYTPSGVTVTLTDNTSISGNYAICTFSLGVLQNDDVKFEPPLPAFKLEAINSMVMATYTKIFLKFPRKFWFDTEMALYADPERGRYPVWQSLDHPNFFPGSGIIFVTVTGDYSLRIESLPDGQVKDEILGVMRSMFPNVTIPKPLDFYFPRWNKDPLFRGSYSNWPSSFVTEHHENLRANVGRLFFAGEASSSRYFGFLHGAYFEGQNIAEIVAACISGNTTAASGGCPGLPHTADARNSIPYNVDL